MLIEPSQELIIPELGIHNDWLIAESMLTLGEKGTNPLWRSDPVLWAKERLGHHMWSKQRELMYSVRDYDETAVQSCHNVGKSFTSATVVCWWLDVHPAGEAFVVTSAPTDKQVKAILWREINRMHARGNLLGRTNLSEWYMGKELIAFGRKPADYDPDAFNGIHAKYVLLVLDEANGMPKELWDSGSTLTSNKHSRTLAIGNPDDPTSEFAKKCRPDSGWNVIKISYKDTPNFTNEDVPEQIRDLLISPGWVEKKEREWGADSALFASKCLGEFPENMSSGVVMKADAQACRLLQFPAAGAHEAGIDVGAGGDRTVIRERIGMRAGREEIFVSNDPMATVGQLVEAINKWGVTRVKVDEIGIGWALTGRLRELSSKHNMVGTTHNAEVVGVNFANQALDPDRFQNARAEIYWTIGREYSRLRMWDLEEVDDDVLEELCAPKYEIMDSKGRIKIEPKLNVIQKLGRSPDRAEALLLAYAGTHWYGSFPSNDFTAQSLM